MKIEIIITENRKAVEEYLLQSARAIHIDYEDPAPKITQNGLCLTPKQYKAVYKKLEEIKQILR